MDITIADLLETDIPDGITLFISDDGKVRDVINSYKKEVVFNGKVYSLEDFKMMLENNKKPDDEFIKGMQKVWHMVTHKFDKPMRNLAIDWFYNANLSPFPCIM